MVGVGVGQAGVGESLLEKFRGNDVLLFENPDEHDADQVAEDGLALGEVFALLQAPRPLGHFLVELLAQRGDFQGFQELGGGQAVAGLFQPQQQPVDGGAGRWGRHGGVESGGHVDPAGGGDGQAGLDVAVVGDGVSQGRGCVARGGGGESAGAKGRFGAVETFFRVADVADDGQDSPLVEHGWSVGVDGDGPGVGVALPIVVVGVAADSLQVRVGGQVGLYQGRRFAQQASQDGFRLGIVAHGGEEAVGAVLRRGRGRLGSGGGKAFPGKAGDQFGQLFPERRRQLRERGPAGLRQAPEVPLGDEPGVGLGGGAGPPVDAPLHAVGEDAHGVGAAGAVLLQVTLYLAVGRLGTGAARRALVEIHANLFRFHDDGGVAGVVVDRLEIAGIVGPVSADFMFGYPVSGGVAQGDEDGPYQRVLGNVFIDNAAAIDVAQPVAERVGNGVDGAGAGGGSHGVSIYRRRVMVKLKEETAPTSRPFRRRPKSKRGANLPPIPAPTSRIPAKAGIQRRLPLVTFPMPGAFWIPACAGTTGEGRERRRARPKRYLCYNGYHK